MPLTAPIVLPEHFIRIGSRATDLATGLEVMITHILIEMDGAAKYLVQPRGLDPKTGAPVAANWATFQRLSAIKSQEFDIRRLSGEALPALSAAEKEESQKRSPSPAPFPAIR